MVGWILDKPRMWGLGSAIGPLAFFAFLIVLFIAHQNSVVYPKDDQGLYAYHQDQCERPVDKGRMVEVENTLSNVGYALAGVFVLIRAGSWAGHLLGISLVALSIMSGLYHGTLEKTPQVLDVAGVYAVLLALSIYISYVHVQAEHPLRAPPLWLWLASAGVWVILAVATFLLFDAANLVAQIAMTAVVAAIAALCLALSKAPSLAGWVLALPLLIAIALLGYLMRASFGWDSTAVFIILIVLLVIQVALVFASAPSLDWGTLGWEVAVLGGVFAVAVIPRLADGYSKTGTVISRKLMCSLDSPLQAHAVWHLLSALALLLAYDLMTQFNRDASDWPAVLPRATAWQRS